MIQRIFHPIGQGAFYSERHENFNIIYDCGTEWKNRNKEIFNKVIKQSFGKNDEIDILFISHFDYDHVSKISVLKNHVKNIKRVILPLLSDQEKNMLSNIYRVLNIDLLTLINSTQEYFGADTKIIYVEKYDDNAGPISGDIVTQNIDDINKGDKEEIRIKSGMPITLNSSNNWLFIPYNYEYEQRNIDLKFELENEGFDCGKLAKDPDYTLDKIIVDARLTRKQGGKKFQDIYDRLDGGINQNSMLLYSGPGKKNMTQKHWFNGFYCCKLNYCLDCICCDPGRVACVYTGDSDLNITKISNIFDVFWKDVGTIQIPHHGDIKSFSSQELKDGNYCCPISVGTTNTYGHPSSKVVADIYSKHSCPKMVTELLDSMFIEIVL